MDALSVARRGALGVGVLIWAVVGCQDTGRTTDEGLLTGVPSFQQSVASADAVLYDGSGTITHGGSHEVVVTQDNEVQVTTTTFEGGGNLDPIHPEANFEIPGSGMRFPGWLTIIERAAGGSGGFCNEPSPTTTAFWLEQDGVIPSSREILFNEPVAGVSFFYASFVDVTVDAFDADGNLVESVTGADNFNTGDPCPPTEPASNFNQWDPLGVDVEENVITRVRISGNSNQTTIDDFTTFEKNRARAIVEGEEGGTVTINDESGHPTAGIEIPEGAFEGKVEFTLTLHGLEDPECTALNAVLIDPIGEHCLTIDTDQPGRVQFNELVTVGICLDVPAGADPEDVHVYQRYSDDGEIRRLENVAAPFLSCDPPFENAALAPGDGLWRYAGSLLRRATEWLRPEPLHARRMLLRVDRGFGGHTGDIGSTFIWAFGALGANQVVGPVELRTVDQTRTPDACDDGTGRRNCRGPVEGAVARWFDRDDPAIGKNPSQVDYQSIFDSDIHLAQCTTGDDGTCMLVDPDGPRDYLVIVHFVDNDADVFVGKPMGGEEFFEENQGVLVGPEKKFQVIELVRRDGTVQYSGAMVQVVEGSYLEIVYPDYAVWETVEDGYVYPFLFTSDSDWSVDVCARVPNGYDIVGVYDEEGELVSDTDCTQTFVANETKVVAFEVQMVGSPEPNLNARLRVRGPSGRLNILNLDVPGIRVALDRVPTDPR